MELFLPKKESHSGVKYFILILLTLRIFNIYSIYREILYKKRENLVTSFRKLRTYNYFKKNRRGILYFSFFFLHFF